VRGLREPPRAPGVVLRDGRPAALRRAKKARTTLTVTVDAFAAVDPGALRAEAGRPAPLRDCATAEVDWG
jgi:hypothetical protein